MSEAKPTETRPTETNPTETKPNGLIGIFSQHPVAANLLMVMMFMAGFWGIKQLNTQFFPSFNIDYVSVFVGWSGASSEDVESLITTSLEQELQDVDFVKQMTSTSAEGISSISLEFEEGTDMGLAVDQVKQRVDRVRNLPSGADLPEVTKATRYESVARLLVSSPGDVNEIRDLVYRFEQELLDRGIAKIFISGLPEEEISIEVPSSKLRELGLSLDEIGQRISLKSRDAPVGVIGRSTNSRQLRFRERRETGLEFESLPIISESQGRLVTLGDIATIERKPKEGQTSIYYQGFPAVELSLNRSESGDSLKSAEIFHQWLEQADKDLPAGVVLTPFNERWKLLEGRIDLLVKNGLGGLLLVILILFLFMNARVAWWVSVGIPVSFMAALAILYFLGGSINMVSLFGLIMALGIIVDDAIVVGEDAMTRYEEGDGYMMAAQGAAKSMLGPVFSSSLTTIAAFLPLLLIGGIIGTILRSIPVVVICVILSSLIECFLIMPGHLTHSFRKMGRYSPGRLRQRLDRGFHGFRDRLFRPVLVKAVSFRWATLAISIASLMIVAGWAAGGRLAFQFFPTAEADRIFANVSFVSGTPGERVKDYLTQMERTIEDIQKAKDEQFVDLVISRHGFVEGGDGRSVSGDQYGSIRLELVDPDQRNTRNRDIIKAWRERLPEVPGIENIAIVEPRGGPPGSDIDVRITGESIHQVKAASEQLQQTLSGIAGVSGVGDDAPYGREQMVLSLTPTAQILGLSVNNVSRQLRAAYDGYVVQEISDGSDDVDVTVQLPSEERNALFGLDELNIQLPGGGSETLGNLAVIKFERGFDSIRHSNGKLAVTVIGSVDPAVNNTNKIRSQLESNILPDLSNRLGVQFSFEGRQADQQETLGDMKLGLALALTLIYLVLAWVFGSYGWPLVVMMIIPFGLVGAIVGHVVMEQSITLLSLFGFFGLSGIVVNDSIILVVFYKKLRKQGLGPEKAVIQAACQRLRAVLLTSLTTIAGLTPLLFETSLQAQFLIPMATSLAFGLAFATFLVLFLLPALLLIYENMAARFF
ncbi:MAG: MMPL family transporter [Gammaproteobacteria bacterium]|nr:MMPL family transporter [Gammaproteobacteria bacterium]